MSVTKIASMLERGVDSSPAPQPRPPAPTAARFARDPGEYTTARARLRLVRDDIKGVR